MQGEIDGGLGDSGWCTNALGKNVTIFHEVCIPTFQVTSCRCWYSVDQYVNQSS